MAMLLSACTTPALNTAAPIHPAPPLIAISAKFLGQPYQFDPLGEGEQGVFSQKPLYRFDQFDCQTYVDTVLALTLAQQRQQPFLPILLQLRYENGQPGFTHRAHFPVLQWLPWHIRQGVVKNITSAIATPAQTGQATVIIDLPNWYRHLPASRIYLPHASPALQQHRLQQLHALADKMHPQSVTLVYIRRAALAQVAPHIPNGAILLFVHPPTPPQRQQLGTAMLISHMGFTIWYQQQLYLREASLLHRRVTDVPFLPYVQQQKKMEGVVVLQPEIRK